MASLVCHAATNRAPDIFVDESPVMTQKRSASVSSSSTTSSNMADKEEHEPRQTIPRIHEPEEGQWDTPSTSPGLTTTGGFIQSPTEAAAREYYQGLYKHPYISGSSQCLHFNSPQATTTTTATTSAPPRRHSLMTPEAQLYSQMSQWSLHSAPSSRRTSIVGYDPRRDSVLSITEEETKSSGASTPGEGETNERTIINPLDPRFLGNIPFHYTAAKLREWGGVYLGNRETADAFIRAVPVTIPKPRPQSFPSATTTSSDPPFQTQSRRASSSHVLEAARIKQMAEAPTEERAFVRVRIVPRHGTRKAFYMQKRLPVRSYRISRGMQKEYAIDRSEVVRNAMRPEELGEALELIHSRRSSASSLGSLACSVPTPIHIEYALYRAPLLAAVLLSGHVSKGDTIEFPVPHPDKWTEVVNWIYTGSCDLKLETVEAIEYVGGKINQ